MAQVLASNWNNQNQEAEVIVLNDDDDNPIDYTAANTPSSLLLLAQQPGMN